MMNECFWKSPCSLQILNAIPSTPSAVNKRREVGGRKPFAPAFGYKNTLHLPQRGKRGSVSGFALLSFWRGTVPAPPSNVFFNP